MRGEYMNRYDRRVQAKDAGQSVPHSRRMNGHRAMM
jgi:hypothetical protein